MKCNVEKLSKETLFEVSDALADYGLTWDDVEAYHEADDPRETIRTVWTAELVFFTHEYDGSYSMQCVPRHPNEDGAGLIY